MASSRAPFRARRTGAKPAPARPSRVSTELPPPKRTLAPSPRTAAGAALLLVALDLLGLVVTGSDSLLALGRGPVGAGGLAWRLVALGLLLVLRLRSLAPRPLDRSWLVLLLLLLPALAEFHLAGGRLGGDGVSYYVYTRSLFKDFDLDFTDEYTAYGLITRGDLSIPTRTGLRRSIFAVGPGLLGLPLFALGEGVARVQALGGGDVNLSGYGPCHLNATSLGGLLYGFGALAFMHALLRRHFRPPVALGAVLLVWGATFLYWYMVHQPLMSHAPSAFVAALVVWLWDRGRGARDARGYALLGLATGFAMCVRWQNGVLLVLPALELGARAWRAWRSDPRPLALHAFAILAATFAGALPQMAAWKVIYGEWLLRYPPHGAGFLRLDHPYVLETLFSSRHGLLSWTPVFWAGYLGFVPLLRRRPQLAWPLLVPLLLMTYVNLCSGDWWAGGSFSNRRFDSLLPVFAPAFAAALEGALRFARRHATLGLAALGVPLVAWNLALAAQTERGLIPRDDTVEFRHLVANAWRLTAERVGSPNTWPASWIFAWRHGRPPRQYDLLVGRYLFYRQNNLGGVIEIGVPGDEPMLGEGWARLERQGDVGFRRLRGRALLFAPLDEPEPLDVLVRAQAVGASREVLLRVNGATAGLFVAGAEWADGRVSVPASLWRRELNEVELEAGAGELRVDRVTFARRQAP
jgi:hypothetical protein